MKASRVVRAVVLFFNEAPADAYLTYLLGIECYLHVDCPVSLP